MFGIMLASALVCSVLRNADGSCVQRCENDSISVQKYIKRCPKTEEEKEAEHQRAMEQRAIELELQRQRTEQLKSIERVKTQNQDK